ncbi:S-adenosyl-L-methionine-dependent methyltransferase [Hypoxylon trugodes]|uniref:S-adenosyl-L-methionine-dependent methyltransferase n=1 Tax=Hypoxylon trugodes TaxID=326681 RepID=UPI00219EA1CE|nr:S-adenosyl-L-methionine-dependent methyltransferase [Hypoxylon trugodes]KAI1384552.1 S-adenosyl-L-methionine-dependent methyltransferase [Hypoxylon trugodes]
MAAHTIEQLSETIARTSAQLSLGLKSQGFASPTVNDVVKGPNFEAINVKASRELLDAAYELEALVLGPSKMLSLMAFIYHDISSLGALLEFNIPGLIPLDGTATIAELALKSSLSEDKLTRFIRYATTNFIFREPSPGVVAHTAISAAMVRDPKFCAFLLFVTVNCANAEISIPAACKKWPQSEKLSECAVNEAYGTNDTFFQWLSKDAERQDRFDRGMAGLSGNDNGLAGRPQQLDIEIYPWVEKLGPKAVVVDVGGGSGHISRVLAHTYPEFTVTVQDHPKAISAAKSDPDLPPNLSYQEHDFFSPQPLHGGDVYLFRKVFHNWPRTEAVSIIRALVPALKPGARVLVSEFLMPGAERGESLLEDKLVRQMDLQMMGAFNSKERTAKEYAALFQEADERLKYQAKYQFPGDQKSCIFEAVWEGDS